MKPKRDLETYFKNGDKILRGLTALEDPLGLTRCTKLLYEPLLLDAKARAGAFDQILAGKKAARITLREKRPVVVKFLRDVRYLLTPVLGRKYSDLWRPLGFMEATKLALPRTDAGRCQMLAKVKTYFENNPQREVVADGFTAAAAEALCGPMTDAVTTVDVCKHETRTKRDQRKTAFKALDKKQGALRRELETVLDPMDPKWLKFYDRIPGDPRPPEKVVNVTVTAQPGGRIAADWPDTVRAEHYRVLMEIVGVDPGLVLKKTVEESEVEFTDVPSGATLRLQIVPVNGLGAGTPSDVIELQAA